METLVGVDEDTDDRDNGSLEVRDDLPDISEGIGDWAHEPPEPKLESNETSDPELWDSVNDDKLCDMAGDDVCSSPDLEWQCFNILTH